MILGVTGTRYFDKITKSQQGKLHEFIEANDVQEVHHGDCEGWDLFVFTMFNVLGVKTVAHPPVSDEFRAVTKSCVILPPKPYLDRNKDIVNAVDFLIAAPDGPERQRSGTWSTVRYAKKVGVKGVVWL